jgi:hypothetical protein
MKIALRLLVGVFSLLLLVGCGGGGGNGDGDGGGGGAAPTIDDSFPKLTTVGSVSVPSTPLVPTITIRHLSHWEISKNDRDLFEINLQERGFQWIRTSDTYEKNITIGSTTYKATAHLTLTPPDNKYSIMIGLQNLHGDASESLLEDIFGRLPGKFFSADLSQSYGGNQRAALEAYETELRKDKFDGSGLSVSKTEHGFRYGWTYGVTYSTAAWSIYAFTY